MSRQRISMKSAILNVLSDGTPRGASEIGAMIGVQNRNNIRQALNQQARRGTLVRDSRPQWLGNKERLFTLPEYEDKLPSSDTPWFEQ